MIGNMGKRQPAAMLTKNACMMLSLAVAQEEPRYFSSASNRLQPLRSLAQQALNRCAREPLCGKFTTNNDGMSVTMRSRPNGGCWRRGPGKRATRTRRAQQKAVGV